MRFFRNSGRLLSAIGLVLFPAINANAGVFDFLSPAEPEPQPPTIEQPSPSAIPPLVSPIPPHRFEIHRRITVVRKNPNDKIPTIDHRSLGLKKDGTLREGDAVMTQSRIHIFAGASSGTYRMDEFAKLDEAKGLSSTEQTALTAIDPPANSEIKSASADDLMTGRSTVANSSVAWKWLRDPKGRLIRYVGP